MNSDASRTPPARAIASRSGIAQLCSSRINAAAESSGISARTSQADSSSNTPPRSSTALAPRSAPSSNPSSPAAPRPISPPTIAPNACCSAVLSWLSCKASTLPSASLRTASTSITRTRSLSRSRSSSARISPWNWGWLNPTTSSCTGPMAILHLPVVRPALAVHPVVGLGVLQLPELAAVGGQGPDHEDVHGDDQHRPERVVGDEQEVGRGAECRQGDADDPRPGLPREQPPAGESHNQAEHQVDPAPGGGVELEGVVAGGDVELVLEDRDQALQGLPGADHEHHDRGEDGEADRPAAGVLPAAAGRRILRRVVGHCSSLLFLLVGPAAEGGARCTVATTLAPGLLLDILRLG